MPKFESGKDMFDARTIFNEPPNKTGEEWPCSAKDFDVIYHENNEAQKDVHLLVGIPCTCTLRYDTCRCKSPGAMTINLNHFWEVDNRSLIFIVSLIHQCVPRCRPWIVQTLSSFNMQMCDWNLIRLWIKWEQIEPLGYNDRF